MSELLDEFGRPVEAYNFKLYNNAGMSIDGEYYTSIFQMAVVVLPGDSSLYKEGDTLRAELDFVDIKGRANSGSSTKTLQRYEH